MNVGIKKTGALMIFLSVSMGYLPYPSKAASQDECSIWLCLPSGFPSGCGGAKSAMKKRLKKGKSAMPELHECIVKSSETDSSSSYDSTYSKEGVAAYIPERKQCTKWNNQSGNSGNRVCTKFEVIPAHYVKGTSCQRFGGSNGSHKASPDGCTKTVRWAEVWDGPAQVGATYYW